MRRGTTPTLKIRVTGVALSELENIYVTIKQGNTEVTKTKENYELSVEDDMISVFLTQEDTLSFTKGYVYVQMRAMTTDGNAVASKIEMVPVEEILNDGVIT